MYSPAMPTYTESIATPAINSAWRMAAPTASTVFSASTIVPRCIPSEGPWPMPIIRNRRSATCSAMTAQTLVVPKSSPAIMVLCSASQFIPI